MKKLGKRLQNWGKWGYEDELGTINYITPEKVVQASRLVKQGKIFSLSIAFERDGPQGAQSRRLNTILLMQATGTDVAAGVAKAKRGSLMWAEDMVIMSPHGATHWDALAHMFCDDMMYNKVPCSMVSSRGARKNSIMPVSKRIVSRGVLLDLPLSKQVHALEPGYVITLNDLDECCQKQGVTVQSGDIVLLRTGHMARFLEKKTWEGYDQLDLCPGLSWRATPWFHDHQVAAVASDMMGLDAYNETPEEWFPIHLIFLVNMGLMIGEVWYLDELARDCANDGTYEFLLVANPLPLKGAVGGPVNPTAIK